jgi:hypothetical protein
MTIGEVLDPVMIPIAFGIAVAATLLLFYRLWRRYPVIPARVPMRIEIDGRPSKRSGPKLVLWAAPVILAAMLAVLGAAIFGFARPPDDTRVTIALVFLICAECAWYAGWMMDRQIEIARKMTYRIAPARILRAALPIIVSVVAVVLVAARP